VFLVGIADDDDDDDAIEVDLARLELASGEPGEVTERTSVLLRGVVAAARASASIWSCCLCRSTTSACSWRARSKSRSHMSVSILVGVWKR
jgi:hypothetical protein